MAINPVSDLVLDVAKAADSQQYHSSVAKLQMAKNAPHASAYANASLPDQPHQFNDISQSVAMNGRQTAVHVQENSMLENPYRKFEAFMLQSFIADMFTSDSASVFGKGTGGEIWKSMMAQMMADEISQAGGIGVAALIDENSSTSKSPEQQKKETDFANVAAAAIVNKNQIELVRQFGKG